MISSLFKVYFDLMHYILICYTEERGLISPINALFGFHYKNDHLEYLSYFCLLHILTFPNVWDKNSNNV